MTIIKKFDTEEIKPNKFSKKYIGLSLFGILALVLIEIWVSNTTTVYGEKFESMQKLKSTYLLENQILENEISKVSSLSSIASESADLGFSKPSGIKYIR